MQYNINLIPSLFFNFLFLLFKLTFDLFFFKLIISLSDNANFLKNEFKTIEIKDEYIILGSWYSKLKEPFVTYILCIVPLQKIDN